MKDRKELYLVCFERLEQILKDGTKKDFTDFEKPIIREYNYSVNQPDPTIEELLKSFSFPIWSDFTFNDYARVVQETRYLVILNMYKTRKEAENQRAHLLSYLLDHGSFRYKQMLDVLFREYQTKSITR